MQRTTRLQLSPTLLKTSTAHNVIETPTASRKPTPISISLTTPYFSFFIINKLPPTTLPNSSTQLQATITMVRKTSRGSRCNFNPQGRGHIISRTVLIAPQISSIVITSQRPSVITNLTPIHLKPSSNHHNKYPISQHSYPLPPAPTTRLMTRI